MTTRRLLVLAAVTAASLALGGCASTPPQSRLDDYRGQAERLSGELIAAIPAELAGSTGVLNSRMTLGADISSHEGGGSARVVERRPIGDPRSRRERRQGRGGGDRGSPHRRRVDGEARTLR
ncbi:hypothetical protein GCM10010462_17740 [Microbacterium dextranolyticum]|uniref:Uncharacterized protein n=1 Tax=Microbacterium dextranolyticum TaxID=36806 RepID=A0A9W6HM30_9MICO|nr:hypothetical protein GCM10017591_13310 [Microbacterium dextranolyticum]